jgi:hypothetical protein
LIRWRADVRQRGALHGAHARAQPTLQFARTGPSQPPRKGTNVTLSWPLTTDTGFVLQAKADHLEHDWTNVPGVISNSITLSNQTGLPASSGCSNRNAQEQIQSRGSRGDFPGFFAFQRSDISLK